MQVALPAHALLPSKFLTSNDTVARHDLALLFNQRHHIRVVETEHGRLGLLQRNSAGELIPHVTPETSTVVLARADGVKAGVELQLDNIGDGILL